jgi:hypothetical protein
MPEPEDEPAGPKLDADPLPELGKALADPHGSLPLQFDGNNPVRYSWRPGPVVAVVVPGTKRSETAWQVWNLQSMKQIGAIPAMGGAGSSGMELRVSADGNYISAPIYPPGSIKSTGIEIYSVADGKPLTKLRPPRSDDSRIGITEFAGPGQFLSLHDEGRTGVANVYDVKTGEQVITFNTVGQIDRKANVLSPGGRYLVMFDSFDAKHPIQVYEMKTGKVVRTLKPRVPQVGYYVCGGLAFSPDGKELAALFNTDGGDYLQAWDFETGKRKASHKFTTPLAKTAKAAAWNLIDGYPEPLEWLPDRSGWLAYGQLMIDHDRGKVFWTRDPEDLNVLWQRRFLDADHIVTVMVKSPRERQLEIITLPKDEIEAARKK